MTTPAVLALADGTVFDGVSIGIEGISDGEVVFNTAMTGYQEILTDPSYSRQIVTLTYPHIGNTGINSEDMESAKVHAAGLVIRDLPIAYHNWRAEYSLETFLRGSGLVAIADLDTRKLTRILREKGAQNGCIHAGTSDPEQALAKAREFPGPMGSFSRTVPVIRSLAIMRSQPSPDYSRNACRSLAYVWVTSFWRLQVVRVPSR
jgi:carbamoyl-phosphate synthase small subunit